MVWCVMVMCLATCLVGRGRSCPATPHPSLVVQLYAAAVPKQHPSPPTPLCFCRLDAFCFFLRLFVLLFLMRLAVTLGVWRACCAAVCERSLCFCCVRWRVVHALYVHLHTLRVGRVKNGACSTCHDGDGDGGGIAFMPCLSTACCRGRQVCYYYLHASLHPPSPATATATATATLPTNARMQRALVSPPWKWKQEKSEANAVAAALGG